MEPAKTDTKEILEHTETRDGGGLWLYGIKRQGGQGVGGPVRFQTNAV
jgi:hypothetical protein